MRDINDYFYGESGLACEFGANLSVVALEDAKRIAVDYAEQFKPKWIRTDSEFKPEPFITILLKLKSDDATFTYDAGYYTGFEFLSRYYTNEDAELIEWQPISG